MNELSDQSRGVIFVVIALAILFLWSHYFSPPVPPPQKGGQTTQAVAPAQSGPAQSTSGPVAATAVASAAKPGTVPVVRAATEKVIVVDSPLYRVELSNRGAVVLSWKLKKYLDDQKPPRPLDLVNHDSSQQLGWPFSLMLQDPRLESQANTELYQVSAGHLEAQPAGTSSQTPSESGNFDAPVSITFHFSDGHLDVTKKLNFNQDYQLTVETSVSLDGKPLPSALAWRGGFGDKEVYRASQLLTVFYSQSGKLNLLQYKKLGASGNQTQPALQSGPLEFAGIEDQFFAATFIPDGLADMSLWHWTHNHGVIVDGKPEDQPVAEMAAGSQQAEPLRIRLYVGPKDLALLSKVQPSLEGLVNFGYTGPIAKPLLIVLQWLHRYVPNWGWTIIALTLIINFALFPLKMKSWRSMQKMQKVAPEIRSIQDRYKKYSMNDPRKRKMNEEVMAVYQREGINPMGSCLPMLFQMPIWWALWRVLNGAIELRHAPWSGMWIHDLSAKDPYYILPIADGDHHVPDDEDDAANDGRSGAAKNDGLDAIDVCRVFLHHVERAELVHVYKQPRGSRPAVLFEPSAAASPEGKVQEEENRMSEGQASTPKRPPIKDRPRSAAPFDRQHAIEELKRFLDLAVREMGLDVEYEISALPNSDAGQNEADVVVRFRGADEELLLARNGELLLALEYVAHRCLRLEPALHDRVRFDCGDYRATRLEELKLSARVAAQRVRETGQPFQFNPMSPRDRRIVHLELNGAPGVRTMSEGSGDRRQLVVYPATKK